MEKADIKEARRQQQQRLARQRQVRAMREKEAKMGQAAREKDERITMMMEEQRSRLAEEYVRECAKWQKEAVGMRARGLEIKEGG